MKSTCQRVLLSYDLPSAYWILCLHIQKWDANQIRNKIRTFLNSGAMTTAQFQDAIQISANSYYRFMGQSGPSKGTTSDTFMNAVIFFTKREIAGLKMPRKKKAKTEKSTAKSTTDSAAAPKKSKADQEKELDVSDIKLDGEATDSVPIFLTCDDIRREINGHLKNTVASKASFVRTVVSMFNKSPGQGISTRGLNTFLSAKGLAAGAAHPFFYGAWVYFEKLRIKQGKKKSKKQQDMENAWGPKGMEKHDSTARLHCRPGTSLYIDRFGHVEIKESMWSPPDDGAGWKQYRLA
jgi:hypothetical protein